MRVSLINANLVGPDAVGQSVIAQYHYFRRRGDEVLIYTCDKAADVPDEVAAAVRVVSLSDLVARREPHFAASDLYVYHYPIRYPLLDSIKLLERGVAIFYFHNVTPPELWGAQEGMETLLESRAGVSRLLPYADLVVAVSEYSKADLIENYGCAADRIRVLPMGVPLDDFTPGPPDQALLKKHNLVGRKVILYVGRMAGNKRVDLLVEALPAVRSRVPNAVLLLVGDNASQPAYREIAAAAQARAAELGVADAVIFTGRVADLPAYYRLADVYASASLHEGFGVPILEAMASGAPVVASNATAHPMVVGDAGLLVAPGDAAALAEGIGRVLEDDALCGELVSRGLERVRDFSQEQYAARWGEVVAEAVAWLPMRPFPRPLSLAALQGEGQQAKQGREASGGLLEDDLEQLQEGADVMLRGYTVQSRAPVVGPFIAWARRNATSHLREPYMDPMFHRQEKFNWQTVMVARHLASLVNRQQREIAALREQAGRVEALEARLAQLEARLAGGQRPDIADYLQSSEA